MQKLGNGHHVAEELKAVVSIVYNCFCVPSVTLDCFRWSIN